MSLGFLLGFQASAVLNHQFLERGCCHSSCGLRSPCAVPTVLPPPPSDAFLRLSLYSIVRLLAVFVCLPDCHVNSEGKGTTTLIIIASLGSCQELNNYFLNEFERDRNLIAKSREHSATEIHEGEPVSCAIT